MGTPANQMMSLPGMTSAGSAVILSGLDLIDVTGIQPRSSLTTSTSEDHADGLRVRMLQR